MLECSASDPGHPLEWNGVLHDCITQKVPPKGKYLFGVVYWWIGMALGHVLSDLRTLAVWTVRWQAPCGLPQAAPKCLCDCTPNEAITSESKTQELYIRILFLIDLCCPYVWI